MSLTAEVRLARGTFSLDVALEARDGETIGLVGPNGGGKSTVVRALAGLIPLQHGKLVLDGTVLEGDGRFVRPQDRPIGTVFQDLRLFPHMSAIDNVAFALRSQRLAKSEARARARDMLELMGVAARADARPPHLSGGEAQRVALARALVRQPRLLLLDEPLSALDVAARRSVRTLLGRVLAEHAGVAIVVSHDPVDVMTLADRIAIVESGRCVQEGAPDEIRRRPLSLYASELVGVNVYSGTLEPMEEGVAILKTAEGELVVAMHEHAPQGNVIATLKPSDVSIYTRRPAGSARNVIAGRIASIALGERARVTLASKPAIVAELTLGSLRSLALQEGQEVFASFKATELMLAGA